MKNEKTQQKKGTPGLGFKLHNKQFENYKHLTYTKCDAIVLQLDTRRNQNDNFKILLSAK